MVGAPATADAVARARRLPNLRVGLHVVLADGDPVCEASKIPDLVDGSGRLRSDLARYGTRLMLDRTLRRQMEQEVAAQFEAFRATGLTLDHVNAHRHFHLHPAVAAAILAVGKDYGMKALRVPNEPRRIVAEIEPQTQFGLSLVVAPWAAWLHRRARRAGLTTADAVFGLAWSGQMTARRLRALLDLQNHMAAELVEIYLHPAVANNFAGAAAGYRYTEEFAALGNQECIAALRRSGRLLGGYADALRSRSAATWPGRVSDNAAFIK